MTESPAIAKHVEIPIIKDKPLSDFTTFHLGGFARGIILAQGPMELAQTLLYLNEDKKPFILIGGGSNLVVSNQDLDCYVICYKSEKPLIRYRDKIIKVSGSTSLDALVCFAANHGLGGINYASGIPGTVGGAIVGNAGAFGQQVGDRLESVTLISKDGQPYQCQPSQLGFGYRHSRLKESGEIVVEVCFRVTSANKRELLKERKEILGIRKAKHPDLNKDPCAGSFFRNIEPSSNAKRRQAAGWFLEKAGAKNLRIGGAAIYPNHANIIIKQDGCTPQNVFELSQKMVELVKGKFGLDLVREVRFVGAFDGKPEHLQDRIW